MDEKKERPNDDIPVRFSQSIKIEQLSEHIPTSVVYIGCVYRDCAVEKVISLSIYMHIYTYIYIYKYLPAIVSQWQANMQLVFLRSFNGSRFITPFVYSPL